jgi:linoleate 9S-lipoxygenase
MFGIFDKGQKIKGTVVLMPKNVLDFNAITSIGKGGVLDAAGNLIGGVTSIVGQAVDTATAFLGRNVSMQLISATKTDGLFSIFNHSSCFKIFSIIQLIIYYVLYTPFSYN